jgi:hypothetical protein
MSNYEEIIKKNLQEDLAEKIPATRAGDGFLFSAF